MMYKYICPSKVNICLKILDRRKDGYHNLWSIFVPIYDPCDEMEIGPSDKDGLCIDCNINELKEDNILFKVYKIFGNTTGIWPKIHIRLKKSIPIGAGLGGGSSNAAVFLEYLKRYLDAKEKDAVIYEMAVKCGADVPFFLKKKICIVEGIGEKLREIELAFDKNYLLVVYPNIHISTSWAYKKIDEYRASSETGLTTFPFDIKYLSHLAGRYWVNDFESVVFETYKDLARIKAELLRLGAKAAVLSGSGSSIVALVPTKEILDLIKKRFSGKRLTLFVNKGV